MTHFHKMVIFLILIFNVSFSLNYFSEDSILLFANSLYEEGDYKGALLEYKRLLTLSNRKTKDSLIYFKIALCYEKQKDYKNAISNYQLSVYENELSLFKIAINKTRIKEYNESLNYIKENKKEINFDKIGVVYTINLISISNYTLAKEYMLKNSPFEENYYNSLRNRLDKILKGYEKLPEKNPYLAAFFSVIIPGSGKFYSEKWFDGLFSLSFISSTAIFATLYFMNNGLTSWQAWTLVGTGVVFYFGDIYGSFKAAENYNKQKLNKLEKEKEEILDEIDN